jgi:hypothetical protein
MYQNIILHPINICNYNLSIKNKIKILLKYINKIKKRSVYLCDSSHYSLLTWYSQEQTLNQ